MNERHDELASAWLDGELDDEERGAFAADEAARQASRELARAREALAQPVEVPVGLADQQVSRALAALAGAGDEPSDEAVVVPMRPPTPGRSRPSTRLGRSARSDRQPWLARVAAVGVLVGGIGVGVAAVMGQDPAVRDGDVAMVADPSDPGGVGDAAGGGGPEVMTTGPVDSDPTGRDGAADGSAEGEVGPPADGGTAPDGGATSAPDPDEGGAGEGPDASASAPRLEAAEPDADPGGSSAAAAPDGGQTSETAPADPPAAESSATLAEVATAAQPDLSLDPIALRDHLVARFGPVAQWPADPGAAVQCAALAIGPANGRPQAVVPFERDGAWFELVVPASEAPFLLVPPGCERAA